MEKMTLSKPVVLATLLLTAFSLSACVVPRDRGDRGGWDRQQHWNNDRDWNHGGGWHGKKHDWD